MKKRVKIIFFGVILGILTFGLRTYQEFIVHGYHLLKDLFSVRRIHELQGLLLAVFLLLISIYSLFATDWKKIKAMLLGTIRFPILLNLVFLFFVVWAGFTYKNPQQVFNTYFKLLIIEFLLYSNILAIAKITVEIEKYIKNRIKGPKSSPWE